MLFKVQQPILISLIYLVILIVIDDEYVEDNI